MSRTRSALPTLSRLATPPIILSYSLSPATWTRGCDTWTWGCDTWAPLPSSSHTLSHLPRGHGDVTRGHGDVTRGHPSHHPIILSLTCHVDTATPARSRLFSRLSLGEISARSRRFLTEVTQAGRATRARRLRRRVGVGDLLGEFLAEIRRARVGARH